MALPEIIGISLPDFVTNEAEGITCLLQAGLCRIHIRKPSAPAWQVQRLMEEIPRDLRERLSVHYFPELVPQHEPGGAHQSRNHQIPAQHRGIKSCSCHTLEEVTQALGHYNYLFLSPIFNSLSKKDYVAAFAHDKLSAYLRQCDKKHTGIVALGGIQAANAATARQLGFDGIALLGSLWAHKENTLDIKTTLNNFNQIQQAWNNKNP